MEPLLIDNAALIAHLSDLGRLVGEGAGTYKSPIVLAPARYPRSSGPRGAQVKVWLTSMSGTQLLRVAIEVPDVVGPFTREAPAAALVYRSLEQPFGSLKIRVLAAGEVCIARGEVHYAAPVTSPDLTWFPHVLRRLLSVWQESTRTLRELADRAELRHDVTASAPAESVSDVLAELDGLVGMQPVKDAVRRLVATQDIARRRREIGLRTTAPSPHLVFTGNPGTGKTTVARMIGRLYRSLGLLSSGHVVEVGRSDLVGGYVGQTALKTKEVCESALGGVLFIDEAYSLRSFSGNDYGHEAVETLLTFMESQRGNLAVVVAGYPTEMKSFIGMNPGLASRFDLTLDFPDYSNAELARMLERMFCEHDYRVRETQVPLWENIFFRLPRGRGFGNAREVRRIFDEICAEQAVQLTAAGDFGDHDLWNISPQVMKKVSTRYPWPAEKPNAVRELALGYL